MPNAVNEVLKALPRWLITAAFLVVVIFMIASLFLGSFKIGGYEFGFSSRGKESESVKAPSTYRVRGTVETPGKGNPNEVLVSPQYPPLHPSAEGYLVGLDVWKGPDGRFPKVNFSHPDYWDDPIDLNDPEKVVVVSESADPMIRLSRARSG